MRALKQSQVPDGTWQSALKNCLGVVRGIPRRAKRDRGGGEITRQTNETILARLS